MGKTSRILGVTVMGLTMASACSDETSAPTVEKITGSGARVVRAAGGALTRPSTAAPGTIAAEFVADRAGIAADELRVTTEAAGRGGVTHVRMTQTIDGLRVHGAYAKVALSERGEVLQSIDRLAPATAKLGGARIDATRALTAALAHHGHIATGIAVAKTVGARTEFTVAGDFHQAPTAERVVYQAADGLRIGYEVVTWTGRTNQLDHTLVGGDGTIVAVEDRTQTDSYNVFPEDPGKGAQTPLAGPGAGNAESPAGWLAGAQTTINIRGNNARAYLDSDANNAADSGGTAVSDGNFLTAADLAQAPTTTGNKRVAVQNLFYLNNVIHDILYRHGFDEAAGNFQVDNFGNGGAGNDPVNAEAQDGSGTDNANFSTPTDGSSPRMQMYLWTGSAPDAYVTVTGVNYGAYKSTFGPSLNATGKTGPLAVYNDGTGVASDACEASAVSLTGKIAIVDRGTCNFTVKVRNAQAAGAVAVVIANNVAGGAFAPGGTDRKVKIPSAMVSQADGATLKTKANTSATLKASGLVALQIDGDLDSDIVYHEYGHGLTWRMIGGMSGAIAGAIGEGAADVNAFLVNGDDIIGEYAYSNAAGIRRYPYTNYPLTYAQWYGEVHNDGEIYAGAMWRVLENYLAAGLTVADLQGDWVDGMNFTPSTPAFEDMRDGMLQSVSGTGRECLIWRGFAASGIGVGADGRTQGPNVIITESFALPSGC
jgi:hypothetical protein